MTRPSPPSDSSSLPTLAPGHATHLELPDRLHHGEARRMLVLRVTPEMLDRAGELIAVDHWRMGIFVGAPRAAVVLLMFEALEHEWEVSFDFHAPGAPAGYALRQLAAQPVARVLLVGADGVAVRDDLRYEKGGARLKRWSAAAVQKLEKRATWRPDDFEAAHALLTEQRFPSLRRRWDALEQADPGPDWIALR